MWRLLNLPCQPLEIPFAITPSVFGHLLYRLHGGEPGVCGAAGSIYTLFLGFYYQFLLERGNRTLFCSLSGCEGLNLVLCIPLGSVLAV